MYEWVEGEGWCCGSNADMTVMSFLGSEKRVERMPLPYDCFLH